MTTWIITTLATLVTRSGGALAGQEPPPELAQKKPAWKWTLEERLAERYDPVKWAARMRAHAAKLSEQGFGAMAYDPEQVVIMAGIR